MSKRNARERFERYLLPLFWFLLFLIATQVAFANLPGNKIFAGHDSGFYTLFPHELIRTSAGTWEVKTAFGFVNFQALVTLPFALLALLVGALHLSGAAVVRLFFELQILLCEFGTFWIAWLVLERFYAESTRLTRATAAFIAALVATFNIFTAVLLLYPPSNFQFGVFIWPAVVALELYLLWKKPTISMAILFGIALTLSTLGNPAHTMLGFALVAVIYIANAIAVRSWRWRLLATALIVMLATSVFFWLPAFASIFLYHGNVSAPEGANAAALTSSADLIKLRTTIGALLRFDGLLWWPKTRNAELYNSAFMVWATYVPAALAIVALFSKKWIASAFWVLLLVGIELGKSAHPPFQLNLLALMTSVPVFAAFRQTYDKFALYIMLALPPLAAIGWVALASRRKLMWAAGLAIALVVISMWPFLAGRAAEPYFLTNIPSDYARVDAIMGSDPQARVLSLPGGSNEIHVTDWFKGGNFENLLFRTHAVNGALFKQRSISAAPLYDDFDLIAAQELPELIGLLGMYDIQYVLLHKDYLTSYRMAFDFERYQVLGPLLARASQRLLDADPRLQKIYSGPSLTLYRVKAPAALGHAFASYRAGVALTYENTLLGMSDAGLLAASGHPVILFAGNQVLSTAASSNAHPSAPALPDYIVKAPIIPETPALYREEVALGGERAQAFAQRYWQLAKPTYFIFVQPHGDWLKGDAVPNDNLVGTYSLARPQPSDASMVVRAIRMPRPVFRSVMGLQGEAPWRLSSFADEPAANGIISEADLTDPEAPPVPSQREPYVDPALAKLPIVRASASATLDRTSGTYHLRLERSGEVEELVVASRAVAPILLLNDPKLTFDYDFSDPKLQAAWLRFEFLEPNGQRLFLDKQLDETGHLENFDLRDNLQAGLDRRFSRLAALHQSDPQWVARLPLFNPPQADNFRLVGLHLIMGKPPFTDFSQTPDDVSLRFRGMQIAYGASEPAAHPSVGYHLNFGSAAMRPQLQGVSRLTKLTSHGAVLYTATTTPIRSVSSVSFKVPLPSIDAQQYPWLHLRFWQPVSNQELILKLGFIADGRTREVTPGLEIAPNTPAESASPPAWISKSSFPGLSAPITIDGGLLSPAADQGWRELVFDLRRVAAYRANSLRPRLEYVVVKFKLTPAPENPIGVPRNLVFGFGDIAFVNPVTAPLSKPSGDLLKIDRKPALIRSITPLAGAKDQLVIHFAPLQLAAGDHHLATRVGLPWAVRSVTISPRGVHIAPAPRVTIRHIDDELFAVHIDRSRPAWLTFAETYHAGWRLIAGAAPRSRWQWAASMRWLGTPAGDHVMTNAYNNTWFLSGSGPADYVIDFAPQDFAFLGKIVGFTATMIALALMAYWWRR